MAAERDGALRGTQVENYETTHRLAAMALIGRSSTAEREFAEGARRARSISVGGRCGGTGSADRAVRR
jgi:hypothetical protein